MPEPMNRVKKERFSLPSYTLECGRTIPVEIGYETYGKLNRDKSNGILICHFFSAHGHAAGKYSPEEVEVGWWDALIGPGKAIDTNQYFVISSDTLCNIQLKNPYVITTGPGTLNPATGKPYGMSFPQFTYRDMAGIQKRLVETLGIERLSAVIGPSAGGMQALHWAVHFPEQVERCVSVISGARTPVLTSLTYLKAAIDAIQLDPHWKEGDYYGAQEPEKGLLLALQLMNLGAYQYGWYEQTYPRENGEQEPYQHLNHPPSFQKNFEEAVTQRMLTYDANHYLYTARAAMMHNVGSGFSSLEDALGRIQSRVLMIACSSDLLFPPEYSKEVVELIQEKGGRAEYYEFESAYGHMGGVMETNKFADRMAAFLREES